ncbi:MAG: DUF5979 domain-containing protein, partial [Christensenellaceae bacterium]|nr:DUF5979 domain-containing protein [Christensenellaceae bacterium]
SQGEQSREFHFTVYFFNAAGSYPYSGSKSGTIASGGALTLKHGEHVTIAGLPIGASYSITETEANQNGYTTTVTGGNAVVIAGGSTAAFINQRGATAAPTPTPTPSSGGSSGSSTTAPKTPDDFGGGSATPPKTGDELPPLFGALAVAIPLMLILFLTRRRQTKPKRASQGLKGE